MPLSDPPPAPEGGGSLRAKDLVNKVCLFRPESLGQWDLKEGETKPRDYVSCSVWVLDRAGILEESENVRVGWWKAVDQLREKLGEYVGAKPVQEEGSNAIALMPLDGEARTVAERVTAELEGQGTFEDGTEVF